MKTIVIDGVIGWDVTGRDVRRQLRSAGGEDVRVEISSPGGFVFDGLEIFNRLRSYSGNVHTHIMSLAASMGSYIALAGNKITAEDNAVFMIHNVWGFSIGDHRDMRAEADVLEGLSGLLSKAYSDKTGKPVAEVRKMMDDETFLFGDEILKAGFVDEITDGSDGAATNKSGAVAIARGAMDDCLVKMRENEDRGEDIQKIAAMIGDFKAQNGAAPTGGADEHGANSPDNNQTANNGGEINQEVVMDLQKLKAEHPALYAQVMQDGRTEGAAVELDRVKGHLTMAKASGAMDFAIDCIEEGKSLSDQTVIAGYMSASMNKKDIDDKDDDNPDGDLNNVDDQDSDAAEADLLSAVMGHSKKSGGAINPGQEV